MAFDPHKYLIRVQGNRNYLPVAARLIWFREVHPDWGIETHIVKISDEFQSAIFRAEIKDETGRIIATSTKTENSQGFADFVEKAETGAIGRSLALCGFGTQFDPSLMEGEKIVDTPQGGNGEYQSEPQTQPRQAYQKTQSAPREDVFCESCGMKLTFGQAGYSMKMYGRNLCPTHQIEAKNSEYVNPDYGDTEKV